MAGKSIIKVVEKTLREERMVEPGGSVLVGVSGGPDSMALLLALFALKARLKIKLSVAHLDHGLRRASSADQNFARQAAAGLNLPFVSERLAGAKPKANLEEWAREKRYDFLVRAAIRSGAGYIAVGHSADDLAETVLINLMRGAGPAGLSGIPPVREVMTEAGPMFIIRPLIRVSRAEILSYLAAQGQDFRDDRMNRDKRFTRVRVRQELLPLLKTMNPSIVKALGRTAEISRQDLSLIHGLAAESLSRLASREKGSLCLSLPVLAAQPPALRMAIYREAIMSVNQDLRRIALAHLEAVDKLVVSGAAHASLDLPGLRVRREYNKIFFAKDEHKKSLRNRGRSRQRTEETRRMTLPVPGSVSWPGPGGREYVISAELGPAPETAPDHGAEARLDPAKVRLPMEVRSRVAGEGFRPYAMKGTRKLKDIMNQLKVPPAERGLWPIIADREGIVWVPGFRPSHKMKRAEGPVIRITITPPIL